MRTPKAFISVVVMSLVAATVIATPARGQSFSSILDKLNQQKGSQKAINTKIGNVRDDTAVKQKEVNYWMRYARTELKAQTASIIKRIDDLNAEYRRAEAARQSYNNRCSGKRLSRAGKVRCDGEYEQVMAWQRRGAAKSTRLEKDRRDFRNRKADIQKRVLKLTSKIDENENRLRNLTAQLKNVSRTIQQLEAKVKRICESGQNTCEEIHHCASMTWDGARPNLPLAAVTRCK